MGRVLKEETEEERDDFLEMIARPLPLSTPLRFRLLTEALRERRPIVSPCLSTGRE